VSESERLISDVRASASGIFPLPVAPFEAYLLRDDRPAYPMNFFIRLRFSGRFGRFALKSALRTAVARHPLLSAVVRQGRRGRFEWVTPGSQSPAVHWLNGPSGHAYPPATAIDVRKEAGLRLWFAEADETTDLVLQFHHACCDGLGAFQFVGDLLLAYAAACGSTPERAVLRPLEERRLLKRGSFGLTPWKLLRMLPKQLVGLGGVRQFFAHAPVPLVSPEAGTADAELPDHYPAAATQEFDPTESERIRRVAPRLGTTVNDLLVRDLFLALGDWRSRHGQGTDRDWLRLSVPINLRTAADRRVPAANLVSMVFLDRRPAQFADPSRLLKGIHDEMQLIKRLHLGLTFVLSLRALRAVPGALARMTRADRCKATCVFTNLGAPLARVPLPRNNGRIAAGDVILESIDALAPLRPP
jgi:hypothetical protein